MLVSVVPAGPFQINTTQFFNIACAVELKDKCYETSLFFLTNNCKVDLSQSVMVDNVYSSQLEFIISISIISLLGNLELRFTIT